MQPAELIKLVSDPSALREEHIPALRELVRDFPYFQSAQVLLCLADRRWDASAYPQQLKKTAIVCSNRTRLYELVGQVESQMAKVPAQTSDEEVVRPSKLPDVAVEEELRILDAAAEMPGVHEQEKREAFIKADQAKEAGELMELEILKQAVVAVVDKEIIRADESQKNPKESEEIQSQKSPETFSEWLQQFKTQGEQSFVESPGTKNTEDRKGLKKTAAVSEKTSTAEDPATERKRKQQAIIDKIIEKSPGAIRPKEEQKFFTPERKAKESLLENEHLVTETLAKIYAMQGNVAKAIRSYEILSLKYPQKSAYFASLIQKLKQNQ